MDKKILDFQGLNSLLLTSTLSTLENWLPGGKLRSNEYKCGDIKGGQGESLSINIITGRWADFATGEKGGDLISLYQIQNGLSPGEAFRELSNQFGFNTEATGQKKTASNFSTTTTREEVKNCLIKINSNSKPPSLNNNLKNNQQWSYKDELGQLMFIIARVEKQLSSGKKIKTYIPWSFDGDQNKWVNKHWPSPRPLYGLELLDKHPKRLILIVEGEKCAESLREIASERYLILTWVGGSNAVSKTDWTVLKDRSVLIWPDADEPGRKAAYNICGILKDIAKDIKVIKVKDKPEKWDCYDAINTDKMSWEDIFLWAKKNVAKIDLKTFGDEQKLMAQTPPHDIDLPPDSAYNESDLVERTTSIQKKDFSVPSIWKTVKVSLTKGGAPDYNITMTSKIISNLPELNNHIWYDEFSSFIFTDWEPYKDPNDKAPPKIRRWNEDDTRDLTSFIHQKVLLPKAEERRVNSGVHLYAKMNKRNEPKEWLESLKWDGEPRVENSMTSYFGLETSPYALAVSKNFWISLIARIMQPGCKMDTMIVLEGKQGSFKSTALSIIGGKWYMQTSEALDSKDFYQSLRGKWIVEMAELASFAKRDELTIKKMMSNPSDTYRKSYGIEAEDHPRQCVFIGTTNSDEYLSDPTGARRFWPIKIEKINLDALRKDRAQLFAEATSLFKAGHGWHDVPLEETESIQASRMQTHAWKELIEDYLGTHRDFILIKDILFSDTGPLKLSPGMIRPSYKKDVKTILLSLGFCEQVTRFKGKQARYWRRKIEK